MPEPTFFMLSRDQGFPLYINANYVVSVEYLGSREKGHVALILVDTPARTNHYLWGELRAIEAVVETIKFGSNAKLIHVVTNEQVTPSLLFDRKASAKLSEHDAFMAMLNCEDPTHGCH